MRMKVLLTALILCLFSTVTLGFTQPSRQCQQQSILGGRRRAAASSDHDNHDDGDDDDVQLRVYDSTFSPLACQIMHCLAVEQSFRSDGNTCIFLRPPFNERPLTPLECCIDGVLTALGDTSRTVEYWSREEYMNIDAHVDIDENRLLLDDHDHDKAEAGDNEAILYCPKASHVLYLDLKEGLRGPTCIFPGKQGGWIKASAKAKANAVVDLVTVPAVQGRIVRFPGRAMHAVPCPAHRWLMTDDAEKALREAEQEEEEEEEDHEFGDYEDQNDDDDYDDEEEDEDDDIIERSVLLFNTWPDDGPPPRGVHGDYDALNADDTKEDIGRLLAEWEEDYGVNAERIRCNPRLHWREQVLAKSEDVLLHDHLETNEYETQQPIIRVNLMGSRERRVHAEKTVRLITPVGQVAVLQDALTQKTRVTHFRLEEE